MTQVVAETSGTTALGWRVFTYEPELADAQGYWTHSCGARFHYGQTALHTTECESPRSSDGYIYHFGPAEVAIIVAHGAEFGEMSQHPDCQMSLAELRLLYPNLMPALPEASAA